MGRVVTLFFLLIASLTVSPEAKGAWFMEKYDWLPSECAHKLYPMRLLTGDLLLKDGKSLYVPAKAIIDNGWGEIGSKHVVGSPLKPLPVRLKATWFSFAEDKFFSADFPLPYDRLLDLFKKGMISPINGKKATYSRIIIGFGPEGAVSVWIAGERVILEVAKYVGTEITLPWTAVTSASMPKDEYITGVLEDGRTLQELQELKQHGVPRGISDHHSRQYPWGLSISGQKNQILWLRTLNGEREYFDFSQRPAIRSSRALPQKIEVDWEAHTGQKYEAYLTFDDSEVTAAYAKLAEKKSNNPMQLRLEISDEPQVIHTSLTDGTYIIRLNKTGVKSYKSR